MVPLNEKFEKKIVCTFDYIDNEIVEDEVNQELVKKIVFGEDRMLEKKMIAAKEEISNLKDQERALRYVNLRFLQRTDFVSNFFCHNHSGLGNVYTKVLSKVTR